MAFKKKEEELKKDTTPVAPEKSAEENLVLLTEEEYEKIRRKKTKEKINRVLRVCGLIFSFMLVYCGVYDPLFELSYFGFLADKEAHVAAWDFLGLESDLYKTPIFDDPMQFGTWLPKLMITAVIIIVTVGVIYLVVYNIVDIIGLFRNMYRSGIEITRDLSDTVKDTVSEEVKKERTTQNRRKKVDSNLEDSEDSIIKRKPRKKKEVKNAEFDGLSEQDLDILISGGSLDDSTDRLPDLEPSPTDEEISTKDLFK